MATLSNILKDLEDISTGPNPGETPEEYAERAKRVGEAYRDALDAGEPVPVGDRPPLLDIAGQMKIGPEKVEAYKRDHAQALSEARKRNTKIAVAGLGILAAGGIAVATGGINIGSIINAAKNAAEAVREIIVGDDD